MTPGVQEPFHIGVLIIFKVSTFLNVNKKVIRSNGEA